MRHAWIPLAIALGLAPVPGAGAPEEPDWAPVQEAYEQGDAEGLVRALLPIAEGGDPHAQYTLAILHDAGQGVPQDHAEAARWYRRAGERSHPDALFNLGMLHFEGKGVDMDRTEALRLYRLAAREGEPESVNSIGYLYLQGIEVGKDPIEAMAHFLLAAERGSRIGEANRDRTMQELDTNELAFARARLEKLRAEYAP